MSAALLVTTTHPNAAAARALARQLVEDGHAACVQVLPGLTSIYRWDGEIEEASEVLLLIKTTAEAYEALETALTARHPYDVPEVLAFDATAGFPPYLRWLTDTVTGT